MLNIDHILDVNTSFNKSKALHLALYMSKLFGKYYAASWLADGEYDLWKVLISDWSDTSYGFGYISPYELQKLSKLATDCGGWITYPDELINDKNYNKKFVCIDVWVDLYKQYCMR